MPQLFQIRTILKGLGLICLFIAVSGILLTLPLRWFNPSTSAFIVQDGSAAEMFWIDWDDIPSILPLALVASEDQKFPIHNGFDFESISEVLNDPEGPSRGASTITQQLAKNLYLWPSKNIIRKGAEAYLTVLLELFLPKSRILEIYLNIVEYGPHVFGVETACHTYFGKSTRDITVDEAALLIAVLPSPKILSPIDPSQRVRDRVTFIKQAIRYLGGTAYLRNLDD